MPGEGERKTIFGLSLSTASLITLAVQNAILILVMHYSRVMPPVNGRRYFTSTAVFMNELLKLIIASTVAFRDTSRNLPTASYTTVVRTLYNQAFSSDSWKLAIPAALYTLQNSLQYVAVSNLDAATFQVTYQLKILTTALFSVTLLKRRLTPKQWFSLMILMVGVATVTVFSSVSHGESGSSHHDQHLHKKVTRALTTKADAAAAAAAAAPMNTAVGLMAVVTACATSGLAGVYFEKVLKDSAKMTLWVRNVQMSFYSLFPAFFIGVIFKDGREIQKIGFFAGYNGVVWTAILCQAIGGLLVAVVVNYADNIAKNFATSISIILSFVVSVWLFDFDMSINFIVGMLFVLYATYLYSTPGAKAVPATGEPPSEQRQLSPEDEEKEYLRKNDGLR